MPSYSQLVKHDAPVRLDENKQFKDQIPTLDTNANLLWQKIEELKKELGRDRTIINNITSGGSGGLNHALLVNLNSVNYYHTTQAQYNSLTGGLDSILHYHATDRARANHTGTQLAATISDFQAAARLTINATAPVLYNNVAGTISLAGLAGLGAANTVLGMNAAGLAYEYKALAGTANRITITHAANLVTFSAPQDIHTGASPTFAGMTLTGFTGAVSAAAGVLSAGTLSVAYGGTGATTLTDHGILLGSGVGAITPLGAATNGQLPIGSTGADPVLAALTGTANQVTVTNGAGTITLSGPQDLAAASSPTFAGLTLTGFAGILYGTAGVVAAMAAGTQNYVPKYNNAAGTTIGNSLIYDTGAGVVIGNTVAASLFELYSSTASPVLTITGLHATDYDPSISFRTDNPATQKAIIGVDSTDDTFRIEAGAGAIGSRTDFAMSSIGNVGFGIAPVAGRKLQLYQSLSNTSGQIGSYYQLLAASGGGAHDATAFYVQAQAYVDLGQTNTSDIHGGEINALAYNLGTLARIRGLRIVYGKQDRAGVLSEAVGLELSPKTIDADVTLGYGIKINAPSGAGGSVLTGYPIFSNWDDPSRIVGSFQIASDTNGLELGTDHDSSIIYNGTAMVINTSLVAASDLDITCGAGKTIELQNTVFEDLQFSLTTGRATPAGNTPTWESFTTNTDAYAFDVNDELDIVCNELPHCWKEATTGHIHLHFAPKTTNATGASRYAKFTVYIAAADTNEVFTEIGPYTGEYTITNGTLALTHLYVDLGDMDLSTFKFGAQLEARVKRIAATGGTEYADDVYITQVGIHLEKDTMGSRTETTK